MDDIDTLAGWHPVHLLRDTGTKIFRRVLKESDRCHRDACAYAPSRCPLRAAKANIPRKRKRMMHAFHRPPSRRVPTTPSYQLPLLLLGIYQRAPYRGDSDRTKFTS